MNPTIQELLAFWLDEVGPEGWYRADDALDQRIRDRWRDTWEIARSGSRRQWRDSAEGCLALLVLLDQFPRNMFRGTPQAFASDARALSVAKTAILHGQERLVGLPQRQFFLTPLMHSEHQADQDQSVRLYLLNFGKGDNLLLHARVHREMIRRFGRFPLRNAALGRDSTPEERRFLETKGYQTLMEELGP